ncbi:hypothetical protein INP83_12125 [Mucilaginibacter sp. 21P]|uniref:hypothetical protein n=1 Tax=Mucilaginibacter sp. 21P TaxID=2778902 RepID=UPI001C5778D7|nr:hypothetical protein [Mucilaginibacter sp. 21P]QXV63852.1 hypothetical protein INP83_12125 [Mucilaginibacter sp. 21P]
MAKITEKDIVEHLKQKIAYHLQEARRIELLLNAFASGDMDGGFNFDKQFGSDDKSDKQKKAGEKVFKPLEPPVEFSQNLTIVNKIAFALNKIGEGYNDEIAKVIADHEPEGDVKKISQLISGVLSTLKASRLINARKDGRKHKFSLVK